MQKKNFELISLSYVTRLDLIIVLMRERNVSSIWIDVNQREMIGIARCSPLDPKGNPCWTVAYDKSQTQLCLASSSCWEKHAILCANRQFTEYSRILITILSLVSVSILLSLLLYYLRRRRAKERRRQFIQQAILSLQDLSLLDWSGDHLPMQALQNEQWETRGGRKILHVAQNFSWIFCPVCIWISIVRPDNPTLGGFVAWPVREKNRIEIVWRRAITDCISPDRALHRVLHVVESQDRNMQYEKSNKSLLRRERRQTRVWLD